MTADQFHTHLRNGSTRLPQACVSGMEWKRNGREEEVGHPSIVSTGRRETVAHVAASAVPMMDGQKS